MMDSPSRSLILRLNALRSPITVRGTTIWPDIHWTVSARYEVRYEGGRWFIDGREATLNDVDNLASRMEKCINEGYIS